MSDERVKQVFGYYLDPKTLTPVREHIALDRKGDYGCDPLEDGTFRMVPSGDIVSREEMDKRLSNL